MRQRFAAALILAASALIQSCGQTGPLYMPDTPPPSSDDAAAAGSQDKTETATEAAAEAAPTPVN
ncbi:LPS translocon maturation chaperone LptM [Parahaliea aestuarii]|nr:lipoprotein [Parahaliea aestuarii]